MKESDRTHKAIALLLFERMEFWSDRHQPTQGEIHPKSIGHIQGWFLSMATGID